MAWTLGIVAFLGGAVAILAFAARGADSATRRMLFVAVPAVAAFCLLFVGLAALFHYRDDVRVRAAQECLARGGTPYRPSFYSETRCLVPAAPTQGGQVVTVLEWIWYAGILPLLLCGWAVAWALFLTKPLRRRGVEGP